MKGVTIVSRIFNYLVIILLAAITFGALMRHPFFIVDDPSYVTLNPMVRMGLALEGLKWSCSSPFYGYVAPLTWFSHALDVELFGTWAGGHHLTSLLFHTASAIFLFQALYLMTGNQKKSLLVSLLFLLHPLQVEAVSWVASRKDILCGFFANMSLYLYASNARAPSKTGYSLLYLTFLCGLLSKTAIIMLPLVLFLLDIWPLKQVKANWTSISRNLLNKIPMLLLTVPFVVFSFRNQKQLGALDVIDAGGVPERISRAAAHYGFYLSKYFNPINLGFPYPRIDLTTAMATNFIFIFLTATFVALLSLLYSRAVFVGFLIFLASLLPFIQLIPVGIQSVSDRWMYLPQIGLSIALVWGIFDLVSEAKQRLVIKYTVSLITLLIIIKLSMQQVEYWSSDNAMFAHVLLVDPNNPAAQTYMANVIASPTTWENTIPYLKAALVSDPLYEPASERLMRVYQQLQQWPELLEFVRSSEMHGTFLDDLTSARKQLQASRLLPPQLAEEQAHLFNEATVSFEKLARDYPDSPGVLSGQAEVLMRTGKTEQAQEKMSLAIELTSGGDGINQSILAQWYQQTGETQKAEHLLRQALWNRPTLQDAYPMLAENLTIQKKYFEAEQFLNKLLLIEPYHIRALLMSADLCFRQGRPQDSIKYFDTVLAKDPNMPDALAGKAAALKIIN